MELIKNNWKEQDIIEFENFLVSLKASEKEINFTKKIVNTKIECLGIKTKIIDDIVNKISKGNFFQFINLSEFNYHEMAIIVGKLISKISDINLFRHNLERYCEKIDNWACTDCIKPNKNLSLNDVINISNEFSKSKFIYKRRMSIVLLLKVLNKDCLQDVFNIIKSLKKENEYYVNMACAWLLCECFIKFFNETLDFFKLDNINEFVYKKTISKCCDSFRIDKENKNLLKTFRKRFFA